MSTRKQLLSDSGSDSEDFDEDSFTLVKGYNQRIRAIYTYRLKEKVLEALAFHTSRQQLKRERMMEAEQFRRESLLIRAYEMLNFNSQIVSRLDIYRRRVAFYKLLEACRKQKSIRHFQTCLLFKKMSTIFKVIRWDNFQERRRKRTLRGTLSQLKIAINLQSE